MEWKRENKWIHRNFSELTPSNCVEHEFHCNEEIQVRMRLHTLNREEIEILWFFEYFAKKRTIKFLEINNILNLKTLQLFSMTLLIVAKSLKYE